MAADEEVTKMKEQLKRAMLLCQQSNKQVLLPQNLSRRLTELGCRRQRRKLSCRLPTKREKNLTRRLLSLFDRMRRCNRRYSLQLCPALIALQVAQLKLAGGEQDGGYDAGLGEELELANARLSESTMQLESVQQELAQQQQQAADKVLQQD